MKSVRRHLRRWQDGDQPFTGRSMKWRFGKTKPMPSTATYDLREHRGFTPGDGPFLGPAPVT